MLAIVWSPERKILHAFMTFHLQCGLYGRSSGWRDGTLVGSGGGNLTFICIACVRHDDDLLRVSFWSRASAMMMTKYKGRARLGANAIYALSVVESTLSF